MEDRIIEILKTVPFKLGDKKWFVSYNGDAVIEDVISAIHYRTSDSYGELSIYLTVDFKCGKIFDEMTLCYGGKIRTPKIFFYDTKEEAEKHFKEYWECKKKRVDDSVKWALQEQMLVYSKLRELNLEY